MPCYTLNARQVCYSPGEPPLLMAKATCNRSCGSCRCLHRCHQWTAHDELWSITERCAADLASSSHPSLGLDCTTGSMRVQASGSIFDAMRRNTAVHPAGRRGPAPNPGWDRRACKHYRAGSAMRMRTRRDRSLWTSCPQVRQHPPCSFHTLLMPDILMGCISIKA